MVLAEPLVQTVSAVGAALREARDPWWIISGAAAALYGAAPISVSDVDVMVSFDDAKRLFQHVGISPEPPSDHPRFRSQLFGIWKGNPLVVEFMANFQLRDLDGVWRPMIPITRQSISLGSSILFVPELQELRMMFARFGRSKDLERIRLLDRLH